MEDLRSTAGAGAGLVAVSTHVGDPAEAVAEVLDACDGRELAGGVLFCSGKYDRNALADAFRQTFGDMPLIGCTSAGELTSRGYDSDSLVFIGFPAGDFEMATLRFTDLDNFNARDAQQTIRQLVAETRRGHESEDMHQVALFFVDGLSHREELLTMTAQEALGDVKLIGGSSGDEMAFHQTGVLHEGAFYEDAAVIAVLTSKRPMHVFCASHYRPGEARMVVTEADPETRTVFEINAAPAAEEYLRLTGIPATTMDEHFFAAHPPMVRIGGNYHVRSIQSVNPDGSLTFYCAIDTGIVLAIGDPVDRIAGIKELLNKVRAEVGEIDHIIGFDCVLNRLDAEDRQLAREVSRLYADNKVLGFNTYGEQFLAGHMNQTFSGLVIGR
ncbi:FIST N-terminal domain-containing protein [Croceicoccus mobilis]|nr:FIST N-terminal domain-containing protein [Croceicoccus mobilis]